MMQVNTQALCALLRVMPSTLLSAAWPREEICEGDAGPLMIVQ